MKKLFLLWSYFTRSYWILGNNSQTPSSARALSKARSGNITIKFCNYWLRSTFKNSWKITQFQQLCVYADQEESFTQIGHVKTSQGQHTFLLTCLARGIPVYSISLRTKISPYHIQIWTKNLLFVSPPASFSWYLIPCGSKWSKDVWVLKQKMPQDCQTLGWDIW